MKKQISIFLILFWIGVMISPIQDAYALMMEYSVVANLPENQINQELTYFYLRMQPGERQELSLTVRNNSDEVIELMIEPNTAITNPQGVIDYSHHEIEKDLSLQHAFSDIISEKQQVTVEANEVKEVTFTLEMPEEAFDGIILGGFHIYQVNLEEPEESGQIQNRFAFVIGAKIRITDTEVQADLSLNEIRATLINYRTAVTANLQNTEATIINNLEVTAQITKEGGEVVLHETTRKGLSMAPNSNFDFPISWDNQPLEAGQYRLYLTATDGNQIWEFERLFEIEAEVASDLNTEAIDLEVDRKLLYIVVSVFATASIMLILMLLIKKRRDKKQKRELIDLKKDF